MLLPEGQQELYPKMLFGFGYGMENETETEFEGVWRTSSKSGMVSRSLKPQTLKKPSPGFGRDLACRLLGGDLACHLLRGDLACRLFGGDLACRLFGRDLACRLFG